MIKTSLLTLAAAASVAVDAVSASPLLAGAGSTSLLARADGANYTDADILNYALTLEHLEATFYADGLKNYTTADFESAGFTNSTRAAVQLLADQEATHVSVLTSALSAAGATPVQACSYSFGVTDVKSFLSLSSVLENVGVSAYLGAAPYISNPDYLTVAAAITTVEARHQAYVAYLDGQDPFPSPFDTAQGFRQVITLAGSFISGCPDGSAPTIEPFAALALSGDAKAGSDISVTAANATLNGTVYCAFASGINATSFANYDIEKKTCSVPSGLVGQTYVVLTSSNTNLTDSNTLAGPAILALGPGSTFNGIKNSPQATSTEVVAGSGLGSSPAPSSRGSSDGQGDSNYASAKSALSIGAILATALVALASLI